MPGRAGRWAALPLAVLALGVAAGAVLVSAPRGTGGPVTVVVEPGLTLTQVARRLEATGVIRSALALRVWGRLAGAEREVKAGTYAFPPGESLGRVLARLRRGITVWVRVTFPEGLTSEEAADIAARRLGMARADYLAAVRDPALRAELGVAAPSLEGYLFPETYHIAPGTAAADLARLQVRTFWWVFGPSWVARAAELGLSVHEVVTLASIVEREARVPEERARIAAVFHNRLARGMMLQADPTVRFVVGDWERPLTARDLAADSPWNTYRVAGLPPGPICNPGKASLEAALYPLAGSRELYFVARGDGTHEFSESLAEHARARARLRRERG